MPDARTDAAGYSWRSDNTAPVRECGRESQAGVANATDTRFGAAAPLLVPGRGRQVLLHGADTKLPRVWITAANQDAPRNLMLGR
jgi:hypothetical protein